MPSKLEITEFTPEQRSRIDIITNKLAEAFKTGYRFNSSDNDERCPEDLTQNVVIGLVQDPEHIFLFPIYLVVDPAVLQEIEISGRGGDAILSLTLACDPQSSGKTIQQKAEYQTQNGMFCYRGNVRGWWSYRTYSGQSDVLTPQLVDADWQPVQSVEHQQPDYAVILAGFKVNSPSQPGYRTSVFLVFGPGVSAEV